MNLKPNMRFNRYYTTKNQDKSRKLAKVLKVRRKNEGEMQFYVHYRGCNKRMDEWIDSDMLDLSVNKNLIELQVNSKLTLEKETPKSEPSPQSIEKQCNSQIKNIERIRFGKYEIDAWYFSPYPGIEENIPCLYICEYCLKYVHLYKTFMIHAKKCQFRQPPGQEIYRKGIISVWEVDAVKEKLYCQNLCLLSKLFLESKLRFFYIDHFLFYIFCEVDKEGAHMFGYFSKAKDVGSGVNLSCILTLPPYQGKGYGKFMISFSYELSKIEKIIATPEKPLSDLGKRSYESYWAAVLLELLCQAPGMITIKELSVQSSINEEDIYSTLRMLNMVRNKREPLITYDPELVNKLLECPRFRKPPYIFDSSCLHWEPEKEPG